MSHETMNGGIVLVIGGSIKFWKGLVDCGLTSHSAISHLYSDGTVIQLQNLYLLLGTQRHRQLGYLACQAVPNTGSGTSEDAFNLLAIRGSTRGEGIFRESNTNLQIHSPARYLYATVVGFEKGVASSCYLFFQHSVQRRVLQPQNKQK